MWFVDASFGEQIGLLLSLLGLFYMVALSISINYRLVKHWRKQVEGRYLINVGDASMAQAVISLLLGVYFFFIVGGEISAFHDMVFCGLLVSGILAKKLSDSVDVAVNKALSRERKFVVLDNNTCLGGEHEA